MSRDISTPINVTALYESFFKALDIGPQHEFIEKEAASVAGYTDSLDDLKRKVNALKSTLTIEEKEKLSKELQEATQHYITLLSKQNENSTLRFAANELKLLSYAAGLDFNFDAHQKNPLAYQLYKEMVVFHRNRMMLIEDSAHLTLLNGSYKPALSVRPVTNMAFAENADSILKNVKYLCVHHIADPKGLAETIQEDIIDQAIPNLTNKMRRRIDAGEPAILKGILETLLKENPATTTGLSSHTEYVPKTTTTTPLTSSGKKSEEKFDPSSVITGETLTLVPPVGSINSGSGLKK